MRFSDLGDINENAVQDEEFARADFLFVSKGDGLTLALSHLADTLLKYRLEFLEFSADLPFGDFIGFGGGRFDVNEIKDLVLRRRQQVSSKISSSVFGCFTGVVGSKACRSWGNSIS